MSGKKVNRGALLMKEKAANRLLLQAEERLKVVEQASSRALRAIERKSGTKLLTTLNPVAVDSSTHESSEVKDV